MTMAALLAEFKRRNVFRVAGLYLVVAWLLMQVATILEGALKLPDWFDGLVTALILLGFPIALILAWAFELTPDGVRITTALDDEAARPTTSRFDVVMLVVLVLVGGLIVADRFFERAPPSKALAASVDQAPPPTVVQGGTESVSVAVLPFVDLSAAKDQEYFSDGLAEELLNVLTRQSDLRVAGRTSSFAFKGKNLDLRKIAKSLNVTHVLEGSVRRAGDQIRVTAQLVKASDGFHVFSETYDRRLDNIFSLQDDLAGRIAKALALRLTGSAKTRPSNGEAYALYLEAREYIHERQLPKLERADRLLDQALGLAPEYAPLHAAKALTTMLLSDGFGFYGKRPSAEALPDAKQRIDRALALDPELAEAHSVLGLYLRSDPDTKQEAIAALRRALAINPNLSEAKLWLANALSGSEAVAILESIVDRDPGFFPAITSLSWHYARKAKRQKLKELYDRAERIPGLRLRVLAARGSTAFFLNDFVVAYRNQRDALEAMPNNAELKRAFAWTLFGLGDHKRAAEYGGTLLKLVSLSVERKIDEAIALLRRSPIDVNLAFGGVILFTEAGRYQEAIDMFESKISPIVTDVAAAGPWNLGHVVVAYQKLGREADAQRVLGTINKALQRMRDDGYSTGVHPLLLSATYESLRGNKEAAESFLRRSIEAGLATAYSWDADLGALRDSPVYAEAKKISRMRVNKARVELGWAPLPPL